MDAKERKRLYASTAWRALRQAQLLANPLCVMCKEEGRLTAASVVDHIKPWRGDLALFYDAGNLQSLCKLHHDSSKQRAEKGGTSKATGLDGWPIDGT